MSKLLINTAVFVLGILLAFVFALRGRLVSFAHNVPVAKEVQVDNLDLPSTLGVSEARLTYAKQRRSLLKKEFSLEQRLKIIERALVLGSSDSLQLLRTEQLRTLPEYRKIFLPRIKYLALEELFKRFTAFDWRAWPVGALSADGSETQARVFVDSIWSVNPELGSFLETAAHLLHGMFVSISSGAPYPLKEDLQYLVVNASEVLSARSLEPEAMDLVFDSQALKDPVVELSFEKIRARLTQRFLDEHPDGLETQLALILDLDHRTVDASLQAELLKILRELSLNASANYRAELLPSIVDSDLLNELSRQYTAVAKSLAQLYAMGAVDAIDANRMVLAEKLLKRSVESSPGLKAQDLLASFLKGQHGKIGEVEQLVDERLEIEPQIIKKAPSVDPVEAALTIPEKESEKSSFGFFSILLTLIGVGALGYFIIYLKNSKNTEAVAFGGGEFGSDELEPEVQGSQLTDPSAIEFDVDDADEEIDFGFGDLASG